MSTDAKLSADKVHLILNYRPLGLVRATALELDGNTIVVDTGCILLPPQAEVEVTFSYRTNGQNRVKRMTAHVVAARAGETRLVLSVADHDALEFVRRMADRLNPARALAGLARSLAGSWPAGVTP